VFKKNHTDNKTDSEVAKLRDENRRLKRAVDELAILNNLALSIGGSLDSEKIMRSIIGKSIRAMNASQGDITLVDENRENSSHTLVRSMVSNDNENPLHLNQNLIGWMQIHKKPLIINEPGNDNRFRNVQWDSSIQSVLSAPLVVKSRLIGILTVYNKTDASGGFDESDQRLLSIIAAQSAQIVENARLYEEEQAYRFMQREISMASDIQKKMLPSESPELSGYSVSGKNLSARSIGGDYFDFIELGNSKWAVCLGDISGKGLPAALLMSNLQAILRSLAVHISDPAEILRHANHLLYKITNPEKFATLFFGVLDTAKHHLIYSSAGHEPPFHLGQEGKCQRLDTGGLPLAVMDDLEYQQNQITLEKGDCIFIYSDGITDSMNRQEEQFGEERLQFLLEESKDFFNESNKLIEKVFNSSIRYCEGTDRFDDMTSVVITRNL